jgi:hypothetical protein
MVGGETTIGEAGVCCLVGGGVNKGPNFINLGWVSESTVLVLGVGFAVCGG